MKVSQMEGRRIEPGRDPEHDRSTVVSARAPDTNAVQPPRQVPMIQVPAPSTRTA